MKNEKNSEKNKIKRNTVTEPQAFRASPFLSPSLSTSFPPQIKPRIETVTSYVQTPKIRLRKRNPLIIFYNVYNARKICHKEKGKEGNETTRL